MYEEPERLFPASEMDSGVLFLVLLRILFLYAEGLSLQRLLKDNSSAPPTSSPAPAAPCPLLFEWLFHILKLKAVRNKFNCTFNYTTLLQRTKETAPNSAGPTLNLREPEVVSSPRRTLVGAGHQRSKIQCGRYVWLLWAVELGSESRPEVRVKERDGLVKNQEEAGDSAIPPSGLVMGEEACVEPWREAKHFSCLPQRDTRRPWKPLWCLSPPFACSGLSAQHVPESEAAKLLGRKQRPWWRPEQKPLDTALSGLAWDYLPLAPCPGFGLFAVVLPKLLLLSSSSLLLKPTPLSTPRRPRKMLPWPGDP